MPDSTGVTPASSAPDFVDIGAAIFVTGSDEALADIVEVFVNASEDPVGTFNTDEVRRTLFRAFVVNANNPEVLELLEHPSGAITLVRRNHEEIAAKIAEDIDDRGYYSKVVKGSAVGASEKDVTFVVVGKDLLTCGLIVVRKSVHEMGDARPDV